MLEKLRMLPVAPTYAPPATSLFTPLRTHQHMGCARGARCFEGVFARSACGARTEAAHGFERDRSSRQLDVVMLSVSSSKLADIQVPMVTRGPEAYPEGKLAISQSYGLILALSIQFEVEMKDNRCEVSVSTLLASHHLHPRH